MSDKPIPFKPINTPISEYEITSGPYKGWRVHISIFVGKIMLDSINPDGTPKIKLAYSPNSTSIPPTFEEEDHR